MAATSRGIDPSDLRGELRRRFGFDEFRPGQEEVVRRVLAGENVLAVMPTGAGKSLCYQLPGLMLPGTALVVSPLIALMQDQAAAMQSVGIDEPAPVVVINSTLSASEQARRLDEVAAGRAKIVWVAPERFRSRRFVEVLKQARISLLAIDEAHCISQWGPDFRPDYLFLREVIRWLGRPPVLGLTATATPEVQRDIVEQLGLERVATVIAGFERSNLFFEVIPCPDEAAKLHQICLLARRGPGIIYCGTRRDCEQAALFLQHAGARGDYYHGRLSSGERLRAHSAFSAGELDAIAATTAFGMGIDKADIRYVAHYDVPGSLEEYYQEAGRAGRDGQPARCLLLYDRDDFRLQEFFIEHSWPTGDELARAFAAIARAAENGRAVFASRDLESTLGLSTTRARVVISELERAGAVHRQVDTPRGEMVIRLLTDELTNEAVINRAAAIAAVKQGRYKKMEQMLAYAEATTCRTAIIRRYFGDAEVPDACGHCDICRASRARVRARPQSEGQLPLAAIILQAVRELDGKMGRTLLAAVLCGSQAKEAAGHRRRRWYGRLADYAQRQVIAAFDRLIKEGYLETRSVGEEDRPRPVVCLAARGREAIDRAAWPHVGPAGEGAGPPETEGALARLREVRRALAAERELAPYRIAHDSTLEAIAGERPRTLAELAAIKGMGERRAERWGEALLTALDAQERAPLSTEAPSRAEHRQAERTVRAFLARPPAKELHGPWAIGRALDFHSERAKGELRHTRAGRMVHDFKYRGERRMLEPLARMLADFASTHPGYKGTDLIAYVPATSAGRDYDPVSLLAQRLAARLGVEAAAAVAKDRATAPQKDMHTQAQKEANVAGAFVVRPSEAVRGRKVLLLDDLFDTGATLAEVWRTLMAAGAAQVVVLTVTKTMHDIMRG